MIPQAVWYLGSFEAIFVHYVHVILKDFLEACPLLQGSIQSTLVSTNHMGGNSGHSLGDVDIEQVVARPETRVNEILSSKMDRGNSRENSLEMLRIGLSMPHTLVYRLEYLVMKDDSPDTFFQPRDL